MRRYIRKSQPGKRLMKKQHTFYNTAKRWLGAQKRRVIALLLVGATGLSMSSALISFAAAAMFDFNLCEHHPVHIELCGYTEGTAEQPCGHTHDESCGYAEAVEGIPCVHKHDVDCGYAEPIPEIPCNQGCSDTDGDGNIVHAAGCSYQPVAEGQPCTHTHDDACGYVKPVAEASCTHEHDADCGYIPAKLGTPCQFVCPICHPEEYPMDERVSIHVPEEANILPPGEKTDLLEGIEVSVEGEGEDGGDAPDPGDYSIALFTVLDSETDGPVEPEDGRYLTPEEGHSYLIVYAAYDSNGDLAAAAERAVSAVKVSTLENEDKLTLEHSDAESSVSFKVEVDFSKCPEADKEQWQKLCELAEAGTLTLNIATKGYETVEADLNSYFGAQYTGMKYSGQAFGVYISSNNEVLDFENNSGLFEKASVTLTFTDIKETTARDLGIGTGKNVFAAVCEYKTSGLTFQSDTAKISSHSTVGSDGSQTYSSITLSGSYEELIGTEGEGPCFILLSADPIPKTAPDFTAYYGVREQIEEEEGAHTKFSVTLPTGTVLTDVNGDKVDFDTNALTLKIKQYMEDTPLDEDDPNAGTFDRTGHKDLIDKHMQWHTGLYDQPAAASTNDGQFWRVWLVDEDGKEVQVKLPEGQKATVVVEYLCPDGDATQALQGDLGTRRTCVMDMGDPAVAVPDNFVNTEDYSLETSYTPGDIDKTDTYYKKITYYLTGDAAGSSAWGNLVALCSMKLADTYVSFMEVTGVRDGLAALDDEEADGKDQDGNDSSETNRRVRTFDSVEYMLEATFATRGTTISTTSVTGTLYGTLDMDPAKARFDTAALNTNYTVSGKAQWQIIYYNAEGTALYVEDPDGIWKCDGNGNKTTTKTSMNEIISGSDNTGGSAYSTSVAHQELTAYKDIAFEGGTASPKDQFPVYINVMAAKNSDTIAPSFAVSVKGNKDNFTSEQNDSGQYIVSEASTANQYEIKEGGDHSNDVVTVTAAPRYNVVIKQSSDTSYFGYFNFAEGTGSDTKQGANDVKGRLTAYGITLQLFNETNWKSESGGVDQTRLAAKGMMGIELPVDGITFDMQMSGYAGEGQTGFDPKELALILWDYQPSRTSGEVQEAGDKGLWERNLYWKNAEVTRYPKGATVYNKASQNQRNNNEVYNGGTWNLTASGDGVDSATNKTNGDPSGDGSATRYTFTVRGFDFDFDNFKTSFPSEAAGSSGKLDWLSEGYVGSFSAGHIQVVQRVPEEIDADASIYAKVVVGDLVEYPDDATANFHAESISGVETNQEAETSKPRDNTTDGMGGTADDGKQVSTQVYAPGTISKHNSFTDRNGRSIATGFLGTSYWEGPNYNASTYAGTDIYLWGAAQLSRNSDAVVSAYNLLQKFDSSKLEIDQSVSGNERLLYTEGNQDANWPGVNWSIAKNSVDGMTNMDLLPAAGDPTFLYAADPMYPDGWDADDPDQMKRMNEADEKDLIYYEKLEDLERDGYTCIGILLEVRNAEIPAGCYPGMRVAMKVKTELTNNTSTVNLVACTVNTAHMWIRNQYDKDEDGGNLLSNVSWKNSTVEKPSANTSTTDFENRLSISVTIEGGSAKNVDVWGWYFGGENEVTSNVKKSFQAEYGTGTTARAIFCGKNDGSKTDGAYNNFPYVKTAYDDGMQVGGTHLGGYQAGMSLLILGYKASLNLDVTNEITGVTEEGAVFAPNQGQNTPLYTIKDIKTTLSNQEGAPQGDSTTNLVVSAYVLNKEDPLEIVTGGYQVESLNSEGEAEWIDVSTDPNNPTEVTIKVGEGDTIKEITYTVYAVYDEGQLKFYLSDVPIGETVAPLRFHAQIGREAENNDQYTVRAAIQGDGDKRAYSETAGNMKDASINVSVTGGAALSKTVDTRYIDQNGSFTYTVSYENTAAQTMDGQLYMYDILPYNGDSRQTKYVDDSELAEASDARTVTKITGSLTSTTGDSLIGSQTKVYQYYSTITPTVLEPIVNFTTTHYAMDSSRTDAQDIDQLLRNALLSSATEGNNVGVYYVMKRSDLDAASGDGTKVRPADIYTYDDNQAVVTGVQGYVDYDPDGVYGEVNLYENSEYVFWNARTGVTLTQKAAEEAGVTFYKVFRWLGVIDPTSGNNSLDTDDQPGGDDTANHLKYASCLYGVAVDLAANSKLSMTVTVRTEGNEAANLYGNQAHAWVSGTRRQAKQASEQVYTYVVGREISGLVWEDLNQDGQRQTSAESSEPLISNVVCTLLKWNDQTNQYEVVKGGDGPNGRNIRIQYMENGATVTKTLTDNDAVQMTTGADGAYHFLDLTNGDYVVAFSGSGLEPYRAAAKYQASGVDGNVNSDGAEVDEDAPDGLKDVDYVYYIKYSNDSTGGNNIHMYDLDEMVTNASTLRNSSQIEEHLDLGLVTNRYELPETGGMGTIFWTAGGLILVWSSLSMAWINGRKRKDELEGEMEQ